jgi:predicted acetylornithine/succinylornithine family transaminase
MTSSADILKLYKQYVMPTYAPDLVLVRGEGSRVWDAEGNRYLDFLAGIAVNSVGHAHPKLVNAIQHQAARLMHVSNLYVNEIAPALARALVERFGDGKCFFCNSGAEANEGMIKLARFYGHAKGRHEIISMQNSFHGRTLAALTATGQTKYQKGFEPLPPGFVYAAFNDLDSVRSLVTDKTIAIFVEAVQGEGGVVPAAPEFMKGLRTLCDERDILLFCDEVQCGMGRTGRWFGFQQFGIQPDACSLAKGLGGGFPIGAIVAGPKLCNLFQPGNHASTFGGNPLACAAALAVIEIIESEHLLARATAAGALFMRELQDIAKRYDWIKQVRSVGLMLGVVLDRPAKELEKRLRSHGLLALATAENVIRFLPPLTVSDEEIREAVRMIGSAFAEWNQTIAAEVHK